MKIVTSWNRLVSDYGNIWDGIRHKLTRLKVILFLKRKVRLRKTLFASSLLLISLSMLAMARLSPRSIRYSREDLAALQEFGNGTGQMELITQIYSSETDQVVLEIETEDMTSNVTKGLNADNLIWQLYFESAVDSSKAEMQVIPVTGNKIYVVVKGVPDRFNGFYIGVFNNTIAGQEVNVDLRDYEDFKQEQRDNQKETTDSDGNDLYFLISRQNTDLEERYIEDLSREKFALQIFNDELEFQKGEKDRLLKAVTELTRSIEEDQKTIEQFKRESQYLVGTQLAEKAEELESVQQSIISKEDRIATAQDNLATLDTIISNLDNNILAVKDGSYQFNFPVRSIGREIK